MQFDRQQQFFFKLSNVSAAKSALNKIVKLLQLLMESEQ